MKEKERRIALSLGAEGEDSRTGAAVQGTYSTVQAPPDVLGFPLSTGGV